MGAEGDSNPHVSLPPDTFRSASGLSVDHPLLFGPAQSVSLVFERLPSAQMSTEQDDDSDILCVRMSGLMRPSTPSSRRCADSS